MDLRVNDVDPELYFQLRLAATIAGKTIKQFVIDALKVAIKQQTPKPKRG
jgi:hypothetical protein